MECNEITNNLKFYFSNGYLYSKNISIWNGDRAITDTFMLDDGTLVYHTYNVTADGREHSHHIGGDHPWIEIDRMNAFRWLSTLSPENLNVALNMMNKEQLQFVADMICAYQQANMENTHITKKICK